MTRRRIDGTRVTSETIAPFETNLGLKTVATTAARKTTSDLKSVRQTKRSTPPKGPVQSLVMDAGLAPTDLADRQREALSELVEQFRAKLQNVKPQELSSVGSLLLLESHVLNAGLRSAISGLDIESWKRLSFNASDPYSVLPFIVGAALESYQDVRKQLGKVATGEELLRDVGNALAARAEPESESQVTEGWQSLLEQGLKTKLEMLRSREFKSTAEASELLGIGEPAVRKRIREKKLFAVKAPGDGELRLPAWSLDPALAGPATFTLLKIAERADPWQLYHFLSTPNGSLNGLRPFECLLSEENLPAEQRLARHDLLADLELPTGASLLDVVCGALKADIEEGLAT